ncbi:BTAD domain-containing putative transcriptional regulator [Streptomyces sp. NPDC051677]|uniref:BTAD domain-containing putative transcriptional regulator n=1 Tax=Streptomyces sp. NPDC051677 TaxID=3365669 RepID=UPI0037CCFA38
MTSLLPAQQWTAFRIPVSETMSRGRLTEQFAHCSSGLVIAPPGFGKTALLAQAAKAHPGPVTWYQARPDADERELLTTLGYPADALAGSAGPPGAGRPARRRDAGDGGAVGRLVVIDDMHLFSAAARALVIRLGQLAPPHPRVLIGTRPAAGLSAAALEAAGATVVNADALRFRSWEVEHLFPHLYDTALRPGIALPLVRATGGRAATLRLFARAVAARPDTGQERILADGMFGREYLEREVLAPLPDRLGRFLTETCLLGRLTADACRALTGRTDSAEMLWSLAHEHGVLRADPDGRTYVAEPLLRECLRARLTGTLTDVELTRLRVRAAACAAAGDHDDRPDPQPSAVRRRLGSADWPDPLRIVVAGGPDIYLGRSVGRVAQEGSGSSAALLVQGIAAALTGDSTAGATVRRALAEATDDALVALSGQLVRVALAVLAGGPARPVPYPELQRIAYDAERLDLLWLSRAARCLLGLGPHPEDAGQPVVVLEECTRLGDAEGAALAASAVCLRSVRTGRPGIGELEDAVRRFRALGWGTLEAWGRAALAVVEVAHDLPDAGQRAAQAEAFARSAGVPGARALAMGAMALAAPDAGHRTELQEAAWSTARSARLPVAGLRSWLTALAAPAGQAPSAQAPTGPVGDYGAAAGRAKAGGQHAAASGRVLAARSAPGLTVRCLGGFEFILAGREHDWAKLRPRAQAVLRLLAVRAGQAVHRDHLLLAFWDGVTTPSTLHNLQVTVSSLRSFLEPERPRGGSRLIARQGDSYRLVLAPGDVSDVAEFERAVREGRRARAQKRSEEAADAFRIALDHYAGELLPEDGYAEWVAGDRERLRREAANSAVALAEIRLAQSRPVDAVEAAERCLEIDGHRDAAWRALIRACDAAGLAADSARARNGYSAMLASLGIPPSGGLSHPM